jgi:hypothetical protein
MAIYNDQLSSSSNNVIIYLKYIISYRSYASAFIKLHYNVDEIQQKEYEYLPLIDTIYNGGQ